jgi:hypothetical protein
VGETICHTSIRLSYMIRRGGHIQNGKKYSRTTVESQKHHIMGPHHRVLIIQREPVNREIVLFAKESLFQYLCRILHTPATNEKLFPFWEGGGGLHHPLILYLKKFMYQNKKRPLIL